MTRLILTARRHCLLILAALTLAASSGHTAELLQSSLTEFEGRYAYFNRTSILFSQSPRDGVLYSILGGAKYALKTISPGVFEDRQGSRVVFERGAAGAISGYSLYEKNATNFFARISREKLPKTTWFARRSPGGAPNHYR